MAVSAYQWGQSDSHSAEIGRESETLITSTSLRVSRHQCPATAEQYHHVRRGYTLSSSGSSDKAAQPAAGSKAAAARTGCTLMSTATTAKSATTWRLPPYDHLNPYPPSPMLSRTAAHRPSYCSFQVESYALLQQQQRHVAFNVATAARTSCTPPSQLLTPLPSQPSLRLALHPSVSRPAQSHPPPISPDSHRLLRQHRSSDGQPAVPHHHQLSQHCRQRRRPADHAPLGSTEPPARFPRAAQPARSAVQPHTDQRFLPLRTGAVRGRPG